MPSVKIKTNDKVEIKTDNESEASPQRSSTFRAAVHNSWRPTYGKVQKCDYCDERPESGVLQKCNTCQTVKVCLQCVDTGRLTAEKRGRGDQHRLEANDPDVSWSPKSKSREQTKSDLPQNKPKRRVNIDEMLRQSEARAAERAARRNLGRSGSPDGDDKAAVASSSPEHKAAKRSRLFIDLVGDDEEEEDSECAGPSKRMRHKVPAENHPSRQIPEQDIRISRQDSGQNASMLSAPGHGYTPGRHDGPPPHQGFNFGWSYQPQEPPRLASADHQDGFPPQAFDFGWPHHPQGPPHLASSPPQGSPFGYYQQSGNPQPSYYQAPWQGPSRPQYQPPQLARRSPSPAPPSPALPSLAAAPPTRPTPAAVVPPASAPPVRQVQTLYRHIFYWDANPTFDGYTPAEIPDCWTDEMPRTDAGQPRLTQQQIDDDVRLRDTMSGVWNVNWKYLPEISAIRNRPHKTDAEEKANLFEALHLLWAVFLARRKANDARHNPNTVMFFEGARKKILEGSS